jgi:hypothetical protein
MKNINYETGLDRLYNVIWVLNGMYWGLATIGRSLGDWIGIFLLAWIGPYFYKKVIVWVYRGFVPSK